MGLWDINIETGEYYANAIWWSMLGYKPEDEPNNFELFFRIIHPEDKQKLNDELNSLAKGKKESFDVLLRLRHSDGKYRYIQDRGQVTEWKNGKAVRAIGTHTDVTDRYLLNEQNETNKHRLEAAIAGANLGVWDTDLVTGKNFANNRWWQMLGYEPDEVENLYDLFYERVHPTDAQRVNAAIDSLRKGRKEQFDLLIRVKHKNGKYIFIQDKAKGVEWKKDGKVQRLVGTHLDVTDNQELTDRLKFHEERLESAIKGADLGVWDSNMKVGMNYANDRWWTMLGYEPGEVENSFDLFFNSVHPDDGKMIMDAINEMSVDGKHSFDLLVRIKHKTGKWIYIQDKGHVVEWEDGKALRLIGTHLDITETHELTEQLRFNQVRLDSAIRGADLGVWDVNLKTGIHYANDRWYEMLGFKPHEVENIFDFFNSRVHPDDQPVLGQEVANLIGRVTNSFDLILRVKHKDGSYRYIQDRSQVVEWEEDRAIRAIGTHLDVTENYELTERLKFNEARLEAAFRGADLGVWDLDLKTGHNYTNDFWWQMLGFEPNEKDYNFDFFMSLVHPNDKYLPIKTLEELEEGSQEKFDLTLRMKHKSGRYLFIQDRGQVVEWEDGKPRRVIGTHLDMTRIYELNNKLKTNEVRLEAAIKGADLGVWDLDLETGFYTTNDRWWEMLGYSALENKSDSDFFMSLVHPDDLHLIFDTLNKLESGEIKDIDITIRLRHKLGHYITILDRGLAVEWSKDKKLKRIIGTMLDITEQVNRQNLLTSALKERNNILEAVDNGFVSLDHDQNVTYLNSTAQKILSIQESELSKGAFLDLFDAVLKAKLKHAIKELKENETPMSFEIQDKEKKTWLRFSLYLKVDGYGIFIQDITESRMFHEQMLENSIRSMENERDRISKELHDGVLQELTAAMMFAENLKHKIQADGLRSHFERLSSLIKKISNDTRRISHDLKAPDLEKNSFRGLLERLIDDVNLTTSIKFEVKFPEYVENQEFNELIKINAFRIIQELILNIIKHSKCTIATLSVALKPEILEVEVKDNGVGIESISAAKAGIGLKNINERINQVDGNLLMVNGKDGGLVTTIKIPIR